MPRPVCVPCKKFYRPAKNDIRWTEGMPVNARTDAEKWVPYKVWAGDLWECPDCHKQIIVGHGHSPMAQKHETNFDRHLSDSFVQIDDC